jgi:membrane associated rhomboid family serine protease
MCSFDRPGATPFLAAGVLYRLIMPAIFVNPEWWDWMMFIIVPILLVILAAAVWAIVSGFMGLLREPDSTAVDRRTIPDIMGFLKDRYIRRNRRFPYESTRRPLIRR